MRTLPANFSAGLASHYKMTWLVKLTGSAATYYWLTNKRGNTATSDVALTESTVGKTYDSSLLAKNIDGMDVYPIGEIEQSVDILMGGAVGSSSDVDITLLNQLRLDTTLAGYELENRTVSIHLGFIPDGASPTLEVTDMITLWTGVFDSHEEDYSQTTCHLKDTRDLRHKSIPQTVIDEEAYPNAPEDSIGQVLPILYGDFASFIVGPPYTYLFYEQLSPCPSICIDKTINKYCIAGHITHTATHSYYHDGKMKSPAPVLIYDAASSPAEATLDTDDSGISTILFQVGTIVGHMIQLFSFAGCRNNLTDYKNAIDGDSTTYSSIANTAGKMLEFMLDSLPVGSINVSDTITKTFIIYLIVDEIVSADSFQVGYANEGFEEVVNLDLAAATGIIQKSFATIPQTTAVGSPNIQNAEDLSKYRFYIKDNPDHAPTAETTKVYAMGLEYEFIIAANNKITDLRYRG